MATLVGQRVFGIALGYEDLIDHDDCATIRCWRCCAGKLAARRGRLRAAGRQEHAEPAGARAAGGADPLPQDRPRRRGDRARCSSSCSSMRTPAAEADRPRPRRHRRSAARPPGRPVLPRLLRLLLLPAALRVLRPASAGGQAAALQHRRRGRGGRGGGAHRRPDPRRAGRGCGSCCAPTAASPARS